MRAFPVVRAGRSGVRVRVTMPGKRILGCFPGQTMLMSRDWSGALMKVLRNSIRVLDPRVFALHGQCKGWETIFSGRLL